MRTRSDRRGRRGGARRAVGRPSQRRHDAGVRTAVDRLHGETCDLLVLGGSTFAAALAWQAATAGLRTVLAAEGDMPSATAVRGRTWLEVAPALGGVSPAAFDEALAERERLLRRVAPFVRPAAVAVALPAAGSARMLLRQLRRAPSSTLPPPELVAGGAGRRIAGFDGVVDEPALARALAAAAAALGAHVALHVACVAIEAHGVVLRARRGDAEARLRASHVVLAMDDAPHAAAAALQSELPGVWREFVEDRSAAPQARGGGVQAALVESGLATAIPGEAHRLCRWLPAAAAAADDAGFFAGAASLGLLDLAPPRRVRGWRPIQAAIAPIAGGKLHVWPWHPGNLHAAATAFLAARLAARPADLRALGEAPAEPMDRLWRRHGWRAQAARRHCAVDAAANELLCPHRPTRRGEVAFAVLEDGAIGFDDVLRRLDDDGMPCQLPGCVAAAHAAYVRVMGGGEADDLAHAMAAFRAAP